MSPRSLLRDAVIFLAFLALLIVVLATRRNTEEGFYLSMTGRERLVGVPFGEYSELTFSSVCVDDQVYQVRHGARDQALRLTGWRVG